MNLVQAWKPIQAINLFKRNLSEAQIKSEWAIKTKLSIVWINWPPHSRASGQIPFYSDPVLDFTILSRRIG